MNLSDDRATVPTSAPGNGLAHEWDGKTAPAIPLDKAGGRMGRPRGFITEAKNAVLLRRLAETGSLAIAAKEASMDGNRVLRMLDEDLAFRQAAFALIETEARAA